MKTLEHGDNKYRGLNIEIAQDIDPGSPREWDHLGTMYCEHNNYQLGDKDADDIRETDEYGNIIENPFQHFKGIILPLFLYDHSGLSMSAGAFSCPWDSGQVGYIYVSDEDIRREYSVKRISAKLRARITAYLISEVETYDQYLTGDVYGYTITDADGLELDSCWGFFGLEFVSQEACSVADWHIKDRRARHFRMVKSWIKHAVPLRLRDAVPC